MDQPLTPLARRVVEHVRAYERRRRRVRRLLVAAGAAVGVGAAAWFASLSAPDAGPSEQVLARSARDVVETPGPGAAGDPAQDRDGFGASQPAEAAGLEAPGIGNESASRFGAEPAGGIADGLRRSVERELLPAGLARAARRYLETGASNDLGSFLADLSNVENSAVHQLLADVVCQSIFHPNEGVRGHAWRSLSRSLPAEQAGNELDRLLRQALDEGEVFDREHAIAFIADHGRRALVPDIGRLLENDDVKVRRRAVRGLGRVGGPEAERLLDPLLEDADSSVRLGAIIALRDCGRPEANDLLYEVALNGPRESRATALIEMRRSGDPRIREVAYSFLTATALQPMLSSACNVLGQLRAPLTPEQTAFLQQVDVRPLHRVAVGYALAAAGADPDATTLISLIDDDSISVRATVVRRLADLDRERFRETILRLRDDPEQHVRDTVEQVLDAGPED